MHERLPPPQPKQGVSSAKQERSPPRQQKQAAPLHNGFPWPHALEIEQHSDHLTQGLTVQVAREWLAALEFPGRYARDSGKLGWLTEHFGPELVGYDICAAIQGTFRECGYHPFSAVEVLLATSKTGVGAAGVFLSHSQREPVEMTLACMRAVELDMNSAVLFFLDYYCLRQCMHDFSLNQLAAAIQAIGRTVMILDSLENAFALTRAFCIYEAYASVTGSAALAVVVPPDQLQQFCSQSCGSNKTRTSLVVDIQAQQAQTTILEDKHMIDDWIQEGPGFEEVDRVVSGAMTHALQSALQDVVPAQVSHTQSGLTVALTGVEDANNATSCRTKVQTDEFKHIDTMRRSPEIVATEVRAKQQRLEVANADANIELMAVPAEGSESVALLAGIDGDSDELKDVSPVADDNTDGLQNVSLGADDDIDELQDVSPGADDDVELMAIPAEASEPAGAGDDTDELNDVSPGVDDDTGELAYVSPGADDDMDGADDDIDELKDVTHAPNSSLHSDAESEHEYDNDFIDDEEAIDDEEEYEEEEEEDEDEDEDDSGQN